MVIEKTLRKIDPINMKRKKEKQDIKSNRIDIKRFEDSMFKVLATMDKELLYILIEEYGINACDRDGRNILMNLIIEHCHDLIKLLLDGYDIDVNAKDLYFRTALHCATIEDDLNSVSRLVSLGAIIDAQDKDGNTPLFFAIRYRVSPAITDFLLAHGASLTISNKYGVKPIDLMKD